MTNVGSIETRVTADIAGMKKAMEEVRKAMTEAGGSVANFERVSESAKKTSDGFAASISNFAKQAGVFKLVDGTISALQGTFKRMVTDGIAAASAYEETTNVLQVSFGEYAESVSQWSEEMASSLGRSVNLIRGNAAEMGALLAPTLQNEQATSALSKAFATLAVDAASFFNKSDEQAFNAIRSGIIGSTQPLQQFGVVLNEAAIEAAALELGIEKSVSQMSEQEKMAARSQAILTKLNQVQGDAAKTAESYANQIKALNAEADDLAREIGQGLVPILSSTISWFNEFRNTTVLEWVAALTTHLQEVRVRFTEAALAAAKFFRASDETISALNATLQDSRRELDAYRIEYGKIINANNEGEYAINKAKEAQERANKTYQEARDVLKEYARSAKGAADANRELSVSGGGAAAPAPSAEEGIQSLVSSALKRSTEFQLSGGDQINMMAAGEQYRERLATDAKDYYNEWKQNDALIQEQQKQNVAKAAAVAGMFNSELGQLSSTIAMSGDIWTLIIGLFVQLGDAMFGLKEILGRLWDANIEGLQELFADFIPILHELLDVVIEVTKSGMQILKPLFDAFTRVLGAVMPLISAALRLGDALAQIVAPILDLLMTIVTSSPALRFFFRIVKLIADAMERLTRFISRATDSLSKFIDGLTSRTKKFFQSIDSRLSESESFWGDVYRHMKLVFREVGRQAGITSREVDVDVQNVGTIRSGTTDAERQLLLEAERQAHMGRIVGSLTGGAPRGTAGSIGGVGDLIGASNDIERFREALEAATEAMRGEFLNIPTVLNLAATRFAAVGAAAGGGGASASSTLTDAANRQQQAADALIGAAAALRGSAGSLGGGVTGGGIAPPRLRFGNPFQSSSNNLGRT